MRPRPIAFVLMAAALLPAAARAQFLTYAELRERHAAIDGAVADLAASELHGSLAHVSAILERPGVRDVASGAAVRGELPPAYEETMSAALDHLRRDLEPTVIDAVEGTPLESRFVLVQTLDAVVFGRNNELWDGWDLAPCEPTEEDPCTDTRPPLVRKLDSLASALRGVLEEATSAYDAARGPGEPPAPPLPEPLDHASIGRALDDLRSTYGGAAGLDWIDYR